MGHVMLAAALVLAGSRCLGQMTLGDFNQAVELNNKGYELLEVENYRGALEHFMEAIRLDSTERIYYLNLNSACNGLKNYKLGQKYFEAAKKIFTEDDEIYYCAGLINKNLGLYRQAVTDLSAAIRLSSNYDDASDEFYAFYFNRGVCYLRLNDFRAAAADFTKTLEINPYHQGSYANRGMARYNLKDKQGACDDWRAAYDNGYEAASTYLTKYCR